MNSELAQVTQQSGQAMAATAHESAQAIERIAATGGQAWLAVTHYAALASLSKAMVQAQIAPKGMGPEQALGVMAFGLELGLGPIMSLKSIAFVNGKPSMYGDGIRALLMRSGKLSDMPTETIEGDGDGRVATCTLHRRDLATPIVRTFSVKDAKVAGLWGKTGPWTQYPDRMLRWRAFGWAARDGFADVLNGLWTREEAMDIPADVVEVRTRVEPVAQAAPVAHDAPPVEAAEPKAGNGGKGKDAAPSKGGVWTPEHKRLADAILVCAGGDHDSTAPLTDDLKAAAKRMCREYSKFTDKESGKEVPGVDSVGDMRVGRVRATWARVKPDYEAAVHEAHSGPCSEPLDDPNAIEAAAAVAPDDMPF